MKFSYRQYEAGDEVAINQLYQDVTGRVRTVEQHAWQWLQAPAGHSEMWLIEAHLEDGSTKLIGHHGVMAMNFTYRGVPIRVGKTENTMVLPEFREKILYPRYEKIFLSKYEHKFHALFSTVGPPSAIRIRRAMGYLAEETWQKLYLGAEPLLSIALVKSKLFKLKRTDLKSILPTEVFIGRTKVRTHLKNSIDSQFDFDGFSEIASKNYLITPSRKEKDLMWRFWSNPYHPHLTLILDDESWGVAICTLSIRKSSFIHVEDIYCENANDIDSAIRVIKKWVKEALNISYLDTITTNESLKYFKASGVRETTWVRQIYGSSSEEIKPVMPRKVTTLGKSLCMKNDEEWFVTPYFFEGR